MELLDHLKAITMLQLIELFVLDEQHNVTS